MNNVSVDFSYMYFKEKSASVNRSDTALVTGSPINYSAKYDNYANIFGVQINWKI